MAVCLLPTGTRSSHQAGSESEFEVPSEALLASMLSMEDSANETSLRECVEVSHPVARLLLEWIDTDEGKHGKIAAKLLSLSKQRRGRAR